MSYDTVGSPWTPLPLSLALRRGLALVALDPAFRLRAAELADLVRGGVQTAHAVVHFEVAAPGKWVHGGACLGIAALAR